MSKRFYKAEVINSVVGAARTGITAITGVAGPTVQDAISQLKTHVDARLFGARYEDGAPQTFRKYLNFKGNVALADNAGLDSLDVTILEQDFVWRGVWSSASVAYNQDDFVTNQGGTWRSKISHTSSVGNAPPILPTTSNTQWEIAAMPGATGAGAGGPHAATHTNGVDQIADATTSVSGFQSGADKTKLNGIAVGAVADHGALTGLSDDDHSIYAKSDGTRLVLATSVSSPGTNQVRLNGLVAERWNGSAWVPLQADANPATPLGVDTPDMATDRSLIEHWSSLSHPTSAIEGQVIYESDTDEFLYNISTNPAAPDFTPLVPSSAGASPPYTQQVGSNATFVAWGDGDPGWAARKLNTSELAARPVGNELGGANIRLVRFRLPRTLVVASAKVFALATDATLRYRWGVYQVSDGQRIWDSAAQSVGTQNQWKVMTTDFPKTLFAGVDYWLAWSTPNPNGTNHYWTMPALRHENVYSGANSPIADKSAGIGQLARASTSGGALPTSLTSILAPDWNNNYGSVPFVFLEGAAT